ncbi:MAG TPA: hypothetical protein VM925_23545, partial [Labilithrix sp.]|nr:hypothetical protein [Labilithrix sp.]
ILSYPRLVELANALLRLLSADTDPLGLTIPPGAPAKKRPKDRVASDRIPGRAHAPLVDLLAAMREELRTAAESPPMGALLSAPDKLDPALVHLNRPLGNLEIARTILLDEDPAFSAGSTPRWVVRRDLRGFAQVALTSGKVPAPFVDVTGPGGKPDGLADIDIVGRFITKGGNAPSPFVLFEEKNTGARDADGRAPVYEYLDVSKTFLSAFARDLVPLLQPDPKRLHETVMDLFGGLVVVTGVREDEKASKRTYEVPGQSESTTLTYRGFREDDSPLLDLVHAFGQVLANEQIDDTLSLVYQLAKDKPQLLARLVRVGLDIKKLADEHPEARIPAGSTFWDEMLDVLVGMTHQPKLIEDIIRALGDPATVELRRSAIAYLTHRDELTYDRDNLNGPAFNLTTKKVETLVTPVDRNKPDTGTNRSAFQRFLQVLHDAKGLSICTKEGAVAHILWKGVEMDFPSTTAQNACVTLGADPPKDPSPLCGMFRIKNVAEEIINAVVGSVTLDVRDDCMQKLMNSSLTGVVGGADAFLQTVSGIDGFSTKPTVPGLNRLIYFDLPTDTSPGDTKNEKTLNFLKDLFDDLPTVVCPKMPFTDVDGAQLNLRQCSGRDDTLRVRDSNALFPLEQHGFLEAAKPLALAFRYNDANLLFVDLFDTFHRHWGSEAQSKQECDPTAPKTNARWCSQDGAVSYEPLLAAALATDLFPALHDAVKELETMPVQHCVARDAKGVCTKSEAWDGVKTLAEAVKALVDPDQNKGVTRRSGEASVKRNDGTTNPQITPVYLLIDALKGFDQRLLDHATNHPDDDRTTSWRRARSQLVDQLFAIEGKGEDAKFANAAVAKILPTVVSTLRAQIAAHCPDPSKGCDWGRKELSSKMTDVVTGPTFAGLLDVMDAVRADEPARTELERFLVFLLQGGQADASSSTLTALADLLQVFEDDKHMTALLHAAAEAAGPEVLDEHGRVVSRGLLFAAIEVMARVLGEVHDSSGTRLCSKEVDPNRTLAVVLRKLVTPQPDGKPSPIEVIIDVVADVNRLHPEETTKLDAADYGSIAREVSEFCTHPSRGLEQVYAVLKQATKDL